jgi:VanZ family protein
MFLLKWVIRVLPAAYMVAIWVMSSMPANAIVELPALSVDRFIKESLHLVEFGILYWLLVLALLTTKHFTPTASIICAIFAGMYGIVDELHQSFVPYRSATIIDGVKDWIGVCVSWYIVREAYFRKERFAGIGTWLTRFQQKQSLY